MTRAKKRKIRALSAALASSLREMARTMGIPEASIDKYIKDKIAAYESTRKRL